jgi:hypothetical protein
LFRRAKRFLFPDHQSSFMRDSGSEFHCGSPYDAKGSAPA